MKIVVVGLGYVGLSNAVLLAQHNDVIGVDISWAYRFHPIVVLNEIELFQLPVGYFPFVLLSDLYSCCVSVNGIRPPVVSVTLLNTNGLTSH